MTAGAPDQPKAVLKPCPFCGGGAIWTERSEVRYLFATTTRTHEWRVQCDECGVASPWNDSREFMAETWNRRPAPEAVRELALEEAAKVAESAVSAGERVRDTMAPKAPIRGLEDALHSIVITTARGIAANIRALASKATQPVDASKDRAQSAGTQSNPKAEGG